MDHTATGESVSTLDSLFRFGESRKKIDAICDKSEQRMIDCQVGEEEGWFNPCPV